MYLVLIICHLIWHTSWNQLVDRVLGIERRNFAQLKGTAAEFSTIDASTMVLLLPLFGLAYHDMHSTDKRFLHAVPDRVMNYVLRVAGGCESCTEISAVSHMPIHS